MKENKTEVGVNESSGAEKVEKIQESASQSPKKQKSVKTVVETEIDVEKMNAESTNGKAERESRAAKARVKAALEKKEAQAKRAEERAKAKQARAEARRKELERLEAKQRERYEKRLAHERALQKKLEEETEKKRREHAHRKANRSDRRAKAKNRGKEERKGYGGWLAAVISLGAVTLALTTAVTVGAIDMKKTKEGVATGYRSTTYELVGIMENVDNDLDRIRISATPAQQSRILTDLLVQARLAELDLEKMPISAEADRNLTSFINRVAMESERMLSKLRNGEPLSARDEAILTHLYEVTHEARTELDNYLSSMTDGDISDYIKGKTGAFSGMLDNLEKMTLEENRPACTDGKKESAGNEKRDELGSSKAETLCARYFSEYKIKNFQCVGETVSRGVKAYNVQGYDDKGTMLFAEIEAESGALLRFDYHETCMEERFDMERCKDIAEEFLEKLGYDDMEVVRVRKNGTNIDFTFAYEDEDVVYYPDSVKLKVCGSRGVVTGMDASEFLKNHKDRVEPSVKISMATARENLHAGLEVESSKLVVVHTARGERPAYEFLCTYAGERYFVYTDAVTGGEIAIVNLKNIG